MRRTTRNLSRPAAKSPEAGFNFFMIAADPFASGLVIAYDPMHARVSASRVLADGSLERVWERDGYRMSASPAIASDRNQLYIDDWRADLMGRSEAHDHFVVLELSTGREIAMIPLSARKPSIGTIFPGMDGDVLGAFHRVRKRGGRRDEGLRQVTGLRGGRQGS